MSSTSKGSAWRLEIQRYLHTHGVQSTYRPWMEAGDDITALVAGHSLSIEAKNVRSITLAAFVDQAEEQKREPFSVPMVWIKRRGRASAGNGYVVMRGHRLMELLLGGRDGQ